MTPRWRLPWSLAVVAGAALAVATMVGSGAGCFSPRQPACAFSCRRAPQSCPERYTCGSDGLCHSDTVQGECPLSLDGGQDRNGDRNSDSADTSASDRLEVAEAPDGASQ